MARKDFRFDFDEDADPVEELHRLRVATARHFKTPDALAEYHNSVPPIEEIRARLKAEIAGEKTRRARPGKRRAAKPLCRRKPAQRLVHA